MFEIIKQNTDKNNKKAKRREISRSDLFPTNLTADMQSSPEIHLADRCRPMYSTASSELKEAGPAEKSPQMELLHGFNRLSSPDKVRRRVSTKYSAEKPPQISRQQSFGREIGHAAAETYLVTRLTFNLLGYLGY